MCRYTIPRSSLVQRQNHHRLFLGPVTQSESFSRKTSVTGIMAAFITGTAEFPYGGNSSMAVATTIHRRQTVDLLPFIHGPRHGHPADHPDHRANRHSQANRHSRRAYRLKR